MKTEITALLSITALAFLPAGAENEGHGNGSEANKPQGFRFANNRLTIKPYVSLSYTYDSNIDTLHHADADSIFLVNPGAEFTWKSDRWELAGSLWYRYNAYCEYNSNMGENSYGESLSYKWSNVEATSGKGWNLLLTERYACISQSDSLMSNDGRGIWRDRQKVDVSGVLERRFTERWHMDVQGQYNWLDYKNDTGKYAPLYGWSEYSAGIQAGYAASKWTDLLIAGGYSDYTQKKGSGYSNYSNDSTVWTIQAGLGTHATERITYRVLVGSSWLDYGGQSNADSGWTYSLSANWQLARQWQISALGSSYYQPSERSLGQAIKVYSIGLGVSYLTLGDRMRLHADISYRREETVYNDRYLTYRNDYDEDLLSVRIGADYTLNRWMSIFANATWEEEWCDDYEQYDYDRFRGTVGVRFHY
ncbi:MAG: hypothetical protein ACI4Q3_01775 [Kiritimatiellia bacterium]